VPLRRVLRNIREAGERRPIVIRSIFMQVNGKPPPASEIDAYLDRLRVLRDAGGRIKLVQVYTVARRPAEACVTPLGDASLEQIARRVRPLGIAAETFSAGR
jgi:hypothetical protein